MMLPLIRTLTLLAGTSYAFQTSRSVIKMSTASGPRNIVVIGGGIQGTSVAFQIAESPSLPAGSTITILEANKIASAASGKGGGFMARQWGDGSSTQTLHELAFDMYEELCPKLGVESYRKLPVLSVAPGGNKTGKQDNKSKNKALSDIFPSWLDGSIGRVSPLGFGDDTAQVTPKEFVEKSLEYVNQPGKPGVKVVIGKCTGIKCTDGDDGDKIVTAVTYQDGGDEDEKVLQADDVIVSAGPWTCQAEQWFDGAIQLPMEGVKSTSIVWKPPTGDDTVDATALFCGEDSRWNTHLEVYPRPDGTVYICGIGGSDYITTSELQDSAFLFDCTPKEDRVEAASSAFTMMSDTYKSRGELDRTQACMRPCPPDAKPYMGKVTGYSGAYINGGHNCWGIAWAPASGKAMAELVLEGESRSVDLRPFNPARYTSQGRGGRGRKKKGMSVGEQW